MEQKKIVINANTQGRIAPNAHPKPQQSLKKRKRGGFLPIMLVVVAAAAVAVWGALAADSGIFAPPEALAVSAASASEPDEHESEPSDGEAVVAAPVVVTPVQYTNAKLSPAGFLDLKLEQYQESEKAYEKKLAVKRVWTVEEMLAAAAALSTPGTGAGNIPAYKQINSDVKGWLKIPGTNINYPVVQGPNTLYYEHLDIYKNKSVNGAIWLDSNSYTGDASQLSLNTIIYGHNWTNYSSPVNVARPGDVMFAQVPSYHYKWFYDRFPYIYFSTEQQEMTWQVFAAFYTDLSFVYNYANPDSATFSSIIATANSKRLYDTGVSVSASDKILTLSTCTRVLGSHSNQRFVVMAKLVK